MRRRYLMTQNPKKQLVYREGEYITCQYNGYYEVGTYRILDEPELFDLSQIYLMVIRVPGSGIELVYEPSRIWGYNEFTPYAVEPGSTFYVDFIMDMSKFNSMAFMFRGCTSLISCDLSHIDLSNCTSLYSTWHSATSLQSLNLSSKDTSKVTNCAYMLWNPDETATSALTSLNMSGCDLSNVTTMQGMCHAQNHPGISFNFNNIKTSSKLTNTYAMFYGCKTTTGFDLRCFNFSGVTNASHMFNNCNTLTSVRFGYNMGAVTNTTNMFANITTSGTLYYPTGGNFSTVINAKPSKWSASTY